MRKTHLFVHSLTHSLIMLLALTLTGSMIGAPAPAPNAGVGDWPQWRGANRDGISKETGFAKQWPSAGPATVCGAEHEADPRHGAPSMNQST